MLITKGATIIPAPGGGGVPDPVRYQTAQTLSLAEEARARANLGFADVFTTAQLNVMDATTSSRIMIAYCSDCFSSAQLVAGTPLGGLVRWSPSHSRWITVQDSVPVTTDFLEWAASLAAMNMSQHIETPTTIKRTVNGSNVVFPLVGGSTSASFSTTSAIATSAFGTNNGIAVRQQINGAGAGGYRGTFHTRMSFNAANNRRKYAIIMSHNSFDASVDASNRWAFMCGARSASSSQTISTPSDMIGFGFDDQGLFGGGNTSAISLVRRESGVATTADAFAGIARDTPAWLGVAVEPISASAARVRVFAQAATSSSWTVKEVSSWTPGSTDLDMTCHWVSSFASASAVNHYMRSVTFVSWLDNAASGIALDIPKPPVA